VLAHRIAYVKAHGIRLSDIDGLVIRHRCDNPSCVNPDHLEVGTQIDNVRDAVQRGRIQKGSKRWKAVLVESDIPFIKYWHDAGFLQKDIASSFGVARSAICMILKGKAWKHA